MNANERELFLKDEVYAIVGAATVVSNELGSGFLEEVYQEALGIEMDARGVPVGKLMNLGCPKLEWKCLILTRPSIGVHWRPFVVYQEGETTDGRQ